MSCQPIVFPPCPVPVCPEQIIYASENGNLNGIGVLDANTSSLGTFRGVVGDGTYISTSLDAGNKSIIVALIPGAIPAAILQATETVAGKGEVATQAETNAGTSDTTFVTPLKLGARVASMTQTGLIEIATQPETYTGTDNTRAITPLRLSEQLGLLLVQQIWANAAARAAAVPDYTGQMGVQFDTHQVFTATGISAGNWQQSYLQPNTTTTLTADTTLVMDSNAWTFSDGVTDFNAGTVGFTNTAINFIGVTTLSVAGVTIPANSVIITSATAGRPSSKLIADFLSTSNPSPAWEFPAGIVNRTAFDQSTVTLPELAKRVAALLTDLFQVKLPTPD